MRDDNKWVKCNRFLAGWPARTRSAAAVVEGRQSPILAAEGEAGASRISFYNMHYGVYIALLDSGIEPRFFAWKKELV
jgi:hypothetical protein